MKVLWSLVLILAVCVPGVLSIPVPQTTKEVLGIPNLMSEVVDPYVAVGLPSDDYIGAGTTIKYNGQVYILTAGHVAKGVGPVSHVRRKSEQGITATVWVCDTVGYHYNPDGWDLALLKPRDPVGLTPALYKGNVPLYRGQDAWIMGTPGGLEGMLEHTLISRPVWYSDGTEWRLHRDVYRTVVNGNVWYGNSGGGLYVPQDGHFYLVGVIVELARPGEKSQGLAVTQEDINTFLGEFDKYPWGAAKGDTKKADEKDPDRYRKYNEENPEDDDLGNYFP